MEIKYKGILDYAVKFCQEIFGDNLKAIILGGSGGKNEIIDGWSDLDLYIILKKYDINGITAYDKEMSDFDIHIGTTFYTFKNIQNGEIDTRTKVMFYEKNFLDVNPTLLGKCKYKIDFERMRNEEYFDFPRVLNEFTRMYTTARINIDKQITKKYIKKLTLLIKILIILEFNEYSYGYAKSFKTFKDLANIDDDFNILSAIKNIETSRESILLFSGKVLQYIYEMR